MTEFLGFRLFAVMGSFGEIAVGEVRETNYYPTRSALLGLVAGCLGVRRQDDERQRELSKSISFAVRVDNIGPVLRDYHTVQTVSRKVGSMSASRRDSLSNAKLSTLLSTRDYRLDCDFSILCWNRDEATITLGAIERSLNTPVFVPYVGRKSCPTCLPMEPRLLDARSLSDAFDKLTFSLSASCKGDERRHPVFWEDTAFETGFKVEHEVTRRDQPLSRGRWQFANRIEFAGSWTRQEA